MSQLLLQVRDIQLKREQDKGNTKAACSETTRPLCKDETAFQHVMVCSADATMQYCFSVFARRYLWLLEVLQTLLQLFLSFHQPNSYNTIVDDNLSVLI